MDKSGLKRREALRRLAAGAVGAATLPSWVETLAALARTQAHAHAASSAIGLQDWAPRVLTAQQNDAVIQLTELIIPETDTPGARIAQVNRFIDGVLVAARPADRGKFLDGLAWMDERSRKLFGKDVAAANTAEQTALLTRLSDEENHAAEDRIGVEFFQAIKSMTINGYYTTEIGLRQELGDDGQLFLLEFSGCDHPDHQS